MILSAVALTDSQAPSQSPLIKFIPTSIIPVITSITLLIIVLISSHATLTTLEIIGHTISKSPCITPMTIFIVSHTLLKTVVTIDSIASPCSSESALNFANCSEAKSTTAFMTVSTTSLIALNAVVVASFIHAQALSTISRNHSTLLYAKTSAATIPAMAATARPIGPVSTANTVLNAVNPEIICGINPISNNAGPAINANAAATAPAIAIVSLVDSGKALNQSANFVSHSAASCIAGIKAVPNAICTPSNADPSSVSAPFKLSCMMSAISFAAPCDPYNSLARSATESAPLLAIALKPTSA